MADNIPIDIIRSHHEDRNSIASSKHTTQNPQAQNAEPEVDPDEKYNRDVPPDGGYGWVCVACVFWINAHTWGINSVSDAFHTCNTSREIYPRLNNKYDLLTIPTTYSRAMASSSVTTSHIMSSQTPVLSRMLSQAVSVSHVLSSSPR